MKGAARYGSLTLVLLCAACAPTTYLRPGTSESERDLEACRLESEARTTETLPRFLDYRVNVSAFESGPYELESRMRVAAEDAAENAYEGYFSEQVERYVAPCMQRKGYQLGLLKPRQHDLQYQGRHHV